MATTGILSFNLSSISSKSEPKSMVLGGTKNPAPKLPKRLLLNTGFDGVEEASIWKGNIFLIAFAGI